jgi:hypothetical protein
MRKVFNSDRILQTFIRRESRSGNGIGRQAVITDPTMTSNFSYVHHCGSCRVFLQFGTLSFSDLLHDSLG